MEIRTGTDYNFVPFINEVMSFIAFHQDYSQFYNRCFVKRYLEKASIVQKRLENANNAFLHRKEEIRSLVCKLLRIARELFKDETGVDYTCSCSNCTPHPLTSVPLLSDFDNRLLTCSIQMTNIKIQDESNISGNSLVTNTNKKESSEQPAMQSSGFNELYNICCQEKRYLDDSEDFEENPPKKLKIDSQKKLYVQEDPEINNIIMKCEE